ncbi:RNA polymerase sigma factor [Marilutibacter alkalisoli]|uniref:RNA polymerase sigma factor n=1 Tax=Marilutibacter alkalisoli TaxID=2591633 RepID=UPI0014249B7C|nr:sigma-70 family RNA polymerase sigma factor [Lysobacter alkalisoli]
MSRFATTHWSIIVHGHDQPGQSQEALVAICETYRRPVLSYLRSRGHDTSDAEDLTQEFFTRLIEQRWDRRADPGRGRFRSFLLTALNRFLSNEHAARAAACRGGDLRQVELDDNLGDPYPGRSPEQAFNHAWALTVLRNAGHALERECRGPDKAALYEAINGFLVEKPTAADYQIVARRLGMKPNTVAVHVHRMRQRLRELVQAELVQTVTDAESLEAELEALREIVGIPGGSNVAAG